MEAFSPAWWSALGSIILIDLVLAGDNALVIGIAASRLPPELRKRAVVAGAIGAVAVRAVLTLVVVWLLKIPGLLLAGGLLLVPVAWKLAVPQQADEGHNVAAANTFWGAMKTIIIADALMGVDNMLGVGGAAGGRMDLVVIGLLITIPLVVWGSAFVVKLMDSWPWLAAVGAAVLVYTGIGMVTSDPFFHQYVFDNNTWDTLLKLVLAVAMLLIGIFAIRKAENTPGKVNEPGLVHEAKDAADLAADLAQPDPPKH